MSQSAVISTVSGNVGTNENIPQTLSRPSPSTLTTQADVLAALSALESEEAAVSAALAELLAARAPVVAALERMQTLAAPLEEIQFDAQGLASRVAITATTADRVGGRVKTLDEEMRRVREAGDRVGQVIELKVNT
jgi:conserved oligomeric Golgi complex subunit 4